MSTIKRRIIHALLFEFFALVILVPIMTYGYKVSIFHMGGLAIVLAICAMLCNMIYNHFFEWIERKFAWKNRTLAIRVVHAFGFEALFLMVALPITGFMMEISVSDAFIMDMIFVVFFMLYAFFYNLIYDIVYRHFCGENSK